MNRVQGDCVDLDKPISFSFDGKTYRGYQGDTLASGLLANGIKIVGRSFKYHRARGIISAGSEEPNALVQVGTGAYKQVNLRATMVELYDGLEATSQNCWPSAQFDLSAVTGFFSRIIPAGFYYKTFMWPARAWKFYEKFIRAAAGLGKASEQPDPDRYTQRYAHCDLLIVGGGIAGLAAALAAQQTGMRIIIVDENAFWGGNGASTALKLDDQSISQWIAHAVQLLQNAQNVTLLSRTTLSGYYDDNFLTALERVRDHLPSGAEQHLPRQRFWKIRTKHTILAQGSIERPLLFPDNDKPGIMLAGSIRQYLIRYGVTIGKACVVYTNNDSAYQTALHLKLLGVEVSIADQRYQGETQGSPVVQLAHTKGITIYNGVQIQKCRGSKQLEGVTLVALSDENTSEQQLTGTIEIACDLLAISGGWVSSVHLYSQARGKLIFNDKLQCFLPLSCPQKVHAIGACNGVFDPIEMFVEANKTVHDVVSTLGFKPVPIDTPSTISLFKHITKDIGNFNVRWHYLALDIAKRPFKQFIDFQNDVTLNDIKLASIEGYRSVEHLKRYTTTGMGTDQGKTSNLNALSVMASLLDLKIDQVGTTTFRPPYTPVDFGAIAGQNVGHLFIQERTTPMHQCHLDNDAFFEDVGDWKRPFCFPQTSESIHAAVQRECLAVREHAGLLDASTLGKIEIYGKDAGKFLDMIYTNMFSTLRVGQCRYGVMLNEHGMVFDDGVTTRLEEHRYYMTTTTGGAARVLNWLEEWLQTEWPELEVYCTSVSEQWAVATVTGPKAREILSPLCDIDLSGEAFAHMTYQKAQICGVSGRIFRVSFTGDSAFEVNIPARYGKQIWEAIRGSGERHHLCLYGTETMHVLRAEKGFIIVGQDSDGTMTPNDLGMEWIISKKKEDFLGKRSFSRSDTSRQNRKQLVGILPENKNKILQEGSHIVECLKPKPPMDMLGHITSSYYSPNLERSFAMGVIKNGRARLGEVLYVPLMDGTYEKVKVVKPVFFDPNNKRLQ